MFYDVNSSIPFYIGELQNIIIIPQWRRVGSTHHDAVLAGGWVSNRKTIGDSDQLVLGARPQVGWPSQVEQLD